MNFAHKAPLSPPEVVLPFIATLSKDATGMMRLRMRPCKSKARRGDTSRRLDNELKLQEDIGGTHDETFEAYIKPGYGARARTSWFTPRGKQTIREFGAIADSNKFHPGAFFTLTLPASTSESYEAFANYSGYIVERSMQWLRDRVAGVKYAWVWEWQKRGALHLHIVATGADCAGLESAIDGWWQFCFSLLKQVQARAGVCLFENPEKKVCWVGRNECQFDAQRVEKSVARYLAKYMGKRKEPARAGSHASPVRWWRVSNNALIEIKQRRAAVSIATACPSRLDSIIEAILRAVLPKVDTVHSYLNAKFSFLQNWVFLVDSVTGSRTAWEAALQSIPPDTTLCQNPSCQYPHGSAGGGGTNPDLLTMVGGIMGVTRWVGASAVLT